ncbi:MAG: diacylglycerol/lipid kinase family protein [Chitinophagaceae bacterium]
MSGLFFIVNSRSKSSQQAQFTRALLTHIADQKHEVHRTEYAGHAEVLAREAVQKNAQAIIAVGGDGTVNEVVQAIGLSGIPLGIIPMGSGNGLARHAGVPLNINLAMQLLVQGEIQAVDLAQANDYFFVSNCGFGFDAYITQQIKHEKNRGLPMYIKACLKGYFKYPVNTFQITLNGETLERKAFMLNIANGREFGYGFTIAPQAGMQDGLLDILVVKPFPWYKSIGLMKDAWFKQWDKNALCEHHRANSITVSGPQTLHLQTDGDARNSAAEYHIFVHPKALNLVVPKGQTQL